MEDEAGCCRRREKRECTTKAGNFQLQSWNERQFAFGLRFLTTASTADVNSCHQVLLRMDSDDWGGAGTIPFCVHEGRVLFLLQQTKGGKKEGTLIDFGGARDDSKDTSVRYCAAREFTEETAGLFTTASLSKDVASLNCLSQSAIESSPLIQKEVDSCMALVDEAYSRQLWAVTDRVNSEWYVSFAIRIPYSDLVLQNEFYGDESKRKVRIFYWVTASVFTSLLQRKTTFQNLPLHERVHCLNSLESLISKIVASESS